MWTVMDSPIGELRLVERDGEVTQIEFSPFRDGDGRPRGERDDAHPVLVETGRQLAAYFAGDLKRLRPARWRRSAATSSSGSGRSCRPSTTARPRRTARSRCGSA